MMLEIKDLYVQTQENQVPIIKGISLVLEQGKIYAIMGPNASGKSTLAKVILGDPDYQVVSGDIIYHTSGKSLSILDLPIYERACLGMFMSYQNPPEIPGVKVKSLLMESFNAVCRYQGVPPLDPIAFDSFVKEKVKALGFDKVYLDRFLNVDFSGGEKKRHEILQMSIQNPRLAILDEIDSGLDVDALRMVGEGVKQLHTPKKTFAIITHYERLLEILVPDEVWVINDGKVIEKGDKSLVKEIEKRGYDGLI